MFNITAYFAWYFVLTVLFWLLGVVIYRCRHRQWRWRTFSYSRPRYYYSMLPLLLPAFIFAYQHQTWTPVIIFFAFGLTGMIGETIFAVWWKAVFSRRFWVYHSDVLYRGYTSLLNLVPWGMGGLVYFATLEWLAWYYHESIYQRDYIFSAPFAKPFFAVFIVSLLVSIYLLYQWSKFTKVKLGEVKLNLITYTIFCLPMLSGLAYLVIFRNPGFLIIAAAFGLAAFAIEYLFGKVEEVFLSNKLWYYSYLTFDHRHSTPLNILPFAFGGFYFWTIYRIVLSVIQ